MKPAIQLIAILFLTSLAMVVTPMDALVQTPMSDGVSIRVTATVVDAESVSLDIVTLQNMVLRPEDLLEGQNDIFVSPIMGVNAGLMLLKGNPNAGVNIHYEPEEFIYTRSGDDYISINYLMSGNGVRNQQASKLFETADVFIELNDEGEYFLWIGGLINICNASAGMYSGDFVFEISYL